MKMREEPSMLKQRVWVKISCLQRGPKRRLGCGEWRRMGGEPGRSKFENGGQGCLGSEPEWCGDSGWGGCASVSRMKAGTKSWERSSRLTLTRNLRMHPCLIAHNAFHFTILYHRVYHDDNTSIHFLHRVSTLFASAFTQSIFII